MLSPPEWFCIKMHSDKSLVLNCEEHFHHKTKTTIFEGWEFVTAGEWKLYWMLHCHHQNDFALRWTAMRALLMLGFKSWEASSPQDSVLKPQFLKIEKGEPKPYCTAGRQTALLWFTASALLSSGEIIDELQNWKMLVVLAWSVVDAVIKWVLYEKECSWWVISPVWWRF